MNDKVINMRTLALSLCLAGAAATTPCLAQEAPLEVHVDTGVLQIPNVRVETHVGQIPEVHVETHVLTPGHVQIVQQRGSTNGVKKLYVDGLDSDTLNKYTVAQVYQNLSTMYTPEMAKKTRD